MDGLEVRNTIQKKFIQWKILNHQTGEKNQTGEKF